MSSSYNQRGKPGQHNGNRNNNRSNNRNNNRGNGRHDNRGNNKETKPVTLPYAFVPFAEPGNEERRFPYAMEDIPRHNAPGGKLSGTIRYQLTASSDLVVDARTKLGGGEYISGSTIRGRVRANVSLLSGGAPKFINKSIMLYRDLSNEQYRKRLIVEGKGFTHSRNNPLSIDKAVQVGYLRKEGDKFFIYPAQSFGDRYFLMLKEHWLLNQGSVLKRQQQLFPWSNEELKKINNLQHEVQQLTVRINTMKENKGQKYVAVRKKIEDKFREYGLLEFSRIFRREHEDAFPRELERLANNLSEELYKLAQGQELNDLFKLMVDRWKRKAQIHHIYMMKRGNGSYKPYQQNVSFRWNAGKGVEAIGLQLQEEEKGCLYNSTRVGSKRSHYLIGSPVTEQKQAFEVSQATIDAYQLYYKKFRVVDGKNQNKGNDKERQKTEAEIKLFYNIFSQYEQCCEMTDSKQSGLVVFYKSFKEGKNEQLIVGRTPYFKIPYDYQLSDLLASRPADRIDYEDALFGFVEDEAQESSKKHAYKSRVRFEALDLPEHVHRETQDFLLPTPQASAGQMYLKPLNEKPSSYAKSNSNNQPPQLHGLKYYRVRKKVLDTTVPLELADKANLLSPRKVIRHRGEGNQAEQPFVLEGAVSFANLLPQELGLLLLGLDIKLLRRSQVFGPGQLAKFDGGPDDEWYELIGGGKAYGYGKVKIDVCAIELERQGTDFDSLIADPIETKEQQDFTAYVDAFITGMGGDAHFKAIHLDAYLRSKKEFASREIKDWVSVYKEIAAAKNGQGGGYPKEWVLDNE